MPRNTAGGVVVGPQGSIVLVNQNGNSWSFPKGGIEPNETPRETAAREIWEETGIKDLVFVGDLGVYERHSLDAQGTGEDTSVPPAKKMLFLYTTMSEVLEPHDKEVTGTKWVSVDEALQLLTHPKDREFLQSVRTRVEAV